ncbi:alpha-amylase family glycosyl hydrolase [Corynebacterium uterequi]|nr:alpha-amylase family glycosyl hydrolase [Corynebacterium uterequi]
MCSTPTSPRYPRPSWLERAVFYQVYPQSFADSNGDGIGDLPGITAHLDYLATLGITAMWINPVFDSPFKDAGYDVRDYYQLAPRYGTDADLCTLLTEAHARGIKVLFDLVAGHTSEQHRWFIDSAQPERNAYSDRFIWTSHAFDNGDGMPFIGGETPRDATYVINFFKSQPALNFGYRERRRPWQQPTSAPGPTANREEMAAIIRYWLERGVDGFRVDMADSLVKNDGEDKRATIACWQDIFDRVRPDFPQAAFISEWGKPWQAREAGFDLDFYLDWRGNGYNLLARATEDALTRDGDVSYFNADSPTTAAVFFDAYLSQPEHLSFALISGNHDTPRLAPRLTEAERRLFFTFLLTMPGVPFIYYGDEIGMRYRDLPSLEGGYARTGSRGPMAWDHSTPDVYLPADRDPDAPSVAAALAAKDSLVHLVRELIALRANRPELQATPGVEVLRIDGKLVVYRRGDSVVAINAGRTSVAVDAAGRAVIFSVGEAPRSVADGADAAAVELPPLSAAIFA